MGVPKWVTSVEVFTSGVLAALSFIYAVADVFGLFDSVSVLSGHVNNLILLDISTIVLYLLTDYYNSNVSLNKKLEEVAEERLPAMQRDLEKLVAKSFSLQLVCFDSMRELEEFQVSQILAAESEVLDLSWSHKVSSRHQAEADKQVDEEYEDAIKRISRSVVYKEIFMLNAAGRINKLRRRVSERTPAYSCAYFPPSEVPQFQFVVIDRRTVVFASSRYKIPLAIVDERVGELFANYYDELWEAATKVKEGKVVHSKVLERLTWDPSVASV